MPPETGREPTAGQPHNPEPTQVVIKAALYARVSTEHQREEATIASQVFELKRQVAAAGHALVKEYIDDGYSGAYLDRPALEELRAALKTDTFDAVYFLCADRIARDAVHQNIIIGELLRYKKRIIINGKDYEENPENRFALTVLGAVAEFERAKIAERMMRGRMHRLRMGQLGSNGVTIYGYTYMRRTPTSAPAFVVNEEQAVVVRSIFEMYASGNYTTAGIGRFLEERGVPTYRGGRLWEHGRIRLMLKNPTYAGTRYYNQTTVLHDAPGSDPQGKRKSKKSVYRNRDEWIGIKMPAIVSQELFDKAQGRMLVVQSRYRKLNATSFLSGFLRCADCGRSYGHGYSHERFRLRTGGFHTRERGQYRCSKRVDEGKHHISNRGRCRNTGIATTRLDNTVIGLIRENMLDPEKLARYIEGGGIESAASRTGASAAAELSRIAEAISVLIEKRRRVFDAYAKEEIAAEDFIRTSRTIDDGIVRLRREKEGVLNSSRETGQANSVIASVRQFCAAARARFEACADFDAKRAFLRDYVEKIVWDHGNIAIVGSLPLEGMPGAKLPFRIEGKIEEGTKRKWAQDGRFGSWVPAAIAANFI